MFWGQVLKNNQITTLSSETTRLLHISNAVLVKHGDKDRVFIQLSNHKTRVIIGAFLVNKKELISLNVRILLAEGKDYKMTLINGDDAEVHLTGYLEVQEEESNKILEQCSTNVPESDEKLAFNGEENDSDIDNKQIEKFLQRKTNSEYDSKPQKLRKLYHNKSEKPLKQLGIKKEKLIQKIRTKD